MSCRSGCPTPGAHKTWGECARSARTHVVGCRDAAGGSDYTTTKKWDKELDYYKSARSQGIQPTGTTTSKIDHAIQWSEKNGRAFDANSATSGGAG